MRKPQATSQSQGQGWHVVARPCTEEGRLLARAVPSHSERGDCRQRGAARVLRLLPRESQRSGAQARFTRKPPHEVRIRAGTWDHGLAPKKGGFSLVQCSFIVHVAIAASAARRARVASARAAPPPQREPAQWRASALHAQATPRSAGQSWHVRSRPCTEEGRLLARAVSFHGVWSECRQRGAARARVGSARAAPPPNRERAQWRASALRTQATSPSKGQGWHGGARPCIEGGRLLACAVPFHGAWSGCRQRGTARARVGSARARTPPNRERAQWRASALRTQATSPSEGQGWHMGALPCTEGGRLLARAVPFHGVWSECRQRGAARARVGSAHAGPPPNRERAQWRASALHAQATTPSEDKGWHVGALPCS